MPGSSEQQPTQQWLPYQPPFHWPAMQAFLHHRCVDSLEWGDADSYGRTFSFDGATGHFTLYHQPEQHGFALALEISDERQRKAVVDNIRRILDLDADLRQVESHLRAQLPASLPLQPGIRLPGIWDLFEAGVRAILGQQVSVAAARNLVIRLVGELGEPLGQRRLFPTPAAILASDLSFLKMPQSRRNTLVNLARHFEQHPEPGDPANWLTLKGIGPWTVDYARMRGLSEPDIFLGGDLGVKRALANNGISLVPEQAAPWRSYLTFQLWNLC